MPPPEIYDEHAAAKTTDINIAAPTTTSSAHLPASTTTTLPSTHSQLPLTLPYPSPLPAAAATISTSSLPPSNSYHVSANLSAVNFRRDFFFRRRNGKLNWRKIAQVDLERVVRMIDVDTLQDNVEHITFADIGEEGKSSRQTN